MELASNAGVQAGWRPRKPRPRNHGRLFLVPAPVARVRREGTMWKRIGLTAAAVTIVWLVIWA
jgi:hypothetical protein